MTAAHGRGAPFLKLECLIESFPLVRPFRIHGYLFERCECIRVTLTRNGVVGQGEAAGVYFRGETVATMVDEIESVRPIIEAGLDRMALSSVLPAGGARNALDCAFWDLEAREAGTDVARLVGIPQVKPLLTFWTIGVDEAVEMARQAALRRDVKAIKLKLCGDDSDKDRVRQVRLARPDVLLSVDANQAFSADRLGALIGTLVDCDVRLIEQPCAIGDEAWLDGLDCPIPLAADESVCDLDQIEACVGRFSCVNIKLDKSGGLTNALAMLERVESLGMMAMVGNMEGTSLAMAPGFVLGQRCQFVDLDGPLLLAADRPGGARFDNGTIDCRAAGWGGL
jgi:L-alanine-DL-glutamate epimerase-like enolase superfamily enzyme